MSMINEEAAIQLVMNLIAIRGGSGNESEVSRFIQNYLTEIGVPASAITTDTAHRRCPSGGNTGNLIVRLNGTIRGPRRLLMAHMDTVPLAVESVPVITGDWICPQSSDTALGADNRAGCAVILTAIAELLRRRTEYPPLTLLFTVQEETGLRGARYLSAGKLGSPQLCFNWDGRDPAGLIIGAVGATCVEVGIAGIASHAGVHPEHGINAAVVASMAISSLQLNGWHGLIRKGKQRGTSNIGMVKGGSATNVVMEELCVTAEARSHSPAFRGRIVREFRKAFEKASKSLTNVNGDSAVAKVTEDARYEPFRIPKNSPCVRAAIAAVSQSGLNPQTVVSDGGLDANWLTAHGYPTVTLGCGQYRIHTVDERLRIPEFLQACAIALNIASGGD